MYMNGTCPGLPSRALFFVDATQTFGFCKAIKYTSNGNDLEKFLTTDCV